MVWFPAHVPKCSVISWLAILNRLYTEDRLVLFGMKSISCCSLYPDNESHDHLFFNCSYSTRVWNAIINKLNETWSPRTWANWIDLLSAVKGKSLRSTTIKLAFTVTVYYIWMERNLRKFQNITCSVAVTVHKICLVMKSRLLFLGKLPQGSQAGWFVNEWGLT